MRLDHVVIPCFDAGRTLAFYNGLLRLPLVAAHEGADWGGYPWLMMIFGLKGGGELVLVALRGADQPVSPLPPDSRHYALSVSAPGAIDLWRNRLGEAGVSHWEEVHGDRQSLYFPDPDGTILEITSIAAAGDRDDPDALARAHRWIEG